MRPQAFFLWIALMLSLSIYAQDTRPYCYQFTVVNENDAYTLKFIDHYYTNGLMLRLSKAVNTQKPFKKIASLEAGQQIFTPFKYDKPYVLHPDRPFTALLYLKGGMRYITAKENVTQWSITGGVSGKAAGGRAVQKAFHGYFRFPEVYGWEAQLNSGIGINLQAEYNHHLPIATTGKKWLATYAKMEVLAGTGEYRILHTNRRLRKGNEQCLVGG